MKRETVYELIDGERDYQDEAWPGSALSVLGEDKLLRHYLNEFDRHYVKVDDPQYGVPKRCMHDVRKMAAILIRCIEHHGAPFRVTS